LIRKADKEIIEAQKENARHPGGLDPKILAAQVTGTAICNRLDFARQSRWVERLSQGTVVTKKVIIRLFH